MKQKRINISSGTVFEEKVGYSRAVRVGNIIEVAGTTAMDGAEVMFYNDAYQQSQYIFLKIQQALVDAGGSMKDVVRTRMYTTDMSYSEEIGKAHAEFFKDIKPAATLLEVYSLIQEGLVVEIEATAILSEE
ncbi:MAG: RidA family protein [Bacteroidia bacterium]|nr:RidA family protein [Bacteroidia bacterium]